MYIEMLMKKSGILLLINMPLNLKPEEKEILKKVEENATIELIKEDEKQ